MTHLLPSDQQQTALSAVQDLSGDDVQKQQVAPAAVKQLHLVTHLGAESNCNCDIIFLYFPIIQDRTQQKAFYHKYHRKHCEQNQDKSVVFLGSAG